MKKYYYAGLTCPSCRYPFRTENLARAESFEQTKDGYFRCPNCGAEFINRVNRNIFTESVTLKLPFSEEAESPVPLYRECVPSKIEEAYIEWFSEFTYGIHLITWPWKEVRFIPVAVSELLEKHPGKKIVVTGSFHKSEEEGVNDPVKLISELFSVTIPDDAEDVKSGYLLPKPDQMKQKLFHKYEKEIEVRIQTGRSASGPSSSILQYEQGRLSTVRKKTLTKLRDEYGEDWRGCTINPELEKPAPSEKLFGEKLERKMREYKELMDIIHPDVSKCSNSLPLLKVTFKEKNDVRYAGSDIKYNRKWMDTVIRNADSVKYYRDILSPEIYGSHDLPDSLTAPLTYIVPDIHDYTDPDELFETIKSLHPDILIITDTDSFLKYYKSGSAIINNRLLQLIKACDIPAIMFSTDSEYRQYYNFDKPERRFGHNEDIIIHSVDAKPVLHSMLLFEEKHATPYSPFFSYNRKAHNEQKIPFEFRQYDGVEITGLIEKISKISNRKRDFADKLKRFVYASLLSPVDINNLDESERGKRRSFSININGDVTSYNTICTDLLNPSNPDDIELYDEVLVALEDTFQVFEGNKNPLREMFAKTANELCNENKSCKILFAVSPYETKSFERIVQEDDCFASTKRFIKVLSWNSLESYLKENYRTSVSGQKQKIYVVSAHHPTRYFHFNQKVLSKISKIIFIADSGKEERIRNVINKRLIDEAVIYPVIPPTVPEQVPGFLRTIIQTLQDEILFTSKAEELAEALIDEDEIYYISDGTEASIKESSSPSKDANEEGYGTLKEGDSVILAKSIEGKYVFFSPESSVMINTDRPFEELKLKSLKSSLKNLEGKDIILSMSSYKESFSKHMLENHAEFKAQYGTYGWTSFEDLYMDSTLWIHFIKSAIESYMEIHETSEKTARDSIIELLSEETGKDPVTIWSWLREEEMETSAGVYSLYSIEHPQSLSDVLKIHSVLSEKYVPDITAEDMERSFCAARYIQKFRGDVRKISPKDSATVIKIREELHAVWNDILKEAKRFKPVTAEICVLDKAVYAKKVYNEYIDYIRN